MLASSLAVSRGVINDFVNEVRADERLAAGWSEYSARGRFQPVDGAPRCVLSNAFDAIVVRPAVMTVQIAFPFGKEVGNDRLKLARQHT